MTVDIDSVRARLVTMRRLLDHLVALGPVTRERLERDFAVQLQVERVLTQVVTLATEVNSHVSVRVSGRAPADLRSSFRELADAGWIDRELAVRLQDSTGLRNVLTHEYVSVDLGIVASAVPLVVEGYCEYIRQVAGRL